VVFLGTEHDCPVYAREPLPVGARLAGPVIVEEAGATTVIGPGWRALVDECGNLRLTATG
jgi:N-methylhydantoinase A